MVRRGESGFAKGEMWVNHDCHDLGMMGMMHRRPCPVDSCLRRNDVGDAKGGEWVNHDCHDLGMMGMMHRRPCPVDSCLRRNDGGLREGGMAWVGAYTYNRSYEGVVV